MAGVIKDLDYSDVSVMVLSTGELPRVLVRWSFMPTAQILSNVLCFIDRGESPSEMQQLNAKGIPATMLLEYVDQTANLFDLQKVYYYRVRAVEYQAGVPVQTFASRPVTWDGNLDLVGIYVVDEHLFLHRFVSGVPILIFKKRHEGARCPECWDKILKRVTKSTCESCYGTGFYKGFYEPMEAWASLEPDPKVSQIVDWGKIQPNQTDIQFTNYPLLSEDDIIVELKVNKMWKVINVRAAEKNRTTSLQIARVSAVNPSDIEYRLQVPEDRRRALVAELEKRDREREF